MVFEVVAWGKSWGISKGLLGEMGLATAKRGHTKRIMRSVGETCQRVRPPKALWRSPKVGLVWLAPISSKGNMTGRRKTGAENVVGGGGPKTFPARGLVVCFPLSWLFHSPCHSLIMILNGCNCSPLNSWKLWSLGQCRRTEYCSACASGVGLSTK